MHTNCCQGCQGFGGDDFPFEHHGGQDWKGLVLKVQGLGPTVSCVILCGSFPKLGYLEPNML